MRDVYIYTDGACRGNPDGPGGYGVVLEYEDKEGIKHIKELSQGYKGTTNNRMELMGVIKGLEILKKPCNVKVFTDSQYIANAFNQNWLNNWILNNWTRGKKKEPVKNIDLWKMLLKAKEGHKVEFIWVKGHAGHLQNERCDKLATKAADGSDLLEDIGYIKE
ncbi:ribonuclease HI [Natranaerovirga pectinivora]|uniref:Ribonuclease H n=1 Tax=Natranaerovirga pectinivora TaxID=682400 RepID=A0A4R3MQD3_9FIRM|nr:ribonuclease HI [Natranaerovirga pectinivora]TCT17004.1 ribonuclease HI [Natranaerovirga pectinivora]